MTDPLPSTWWEPAVVTLRSMTAICTGVQREQLEGSIARVMARVPGTSCSPVGVYAYALRSPVRKLGSGL